MLVTTVPLSLLSSANLLRVHSILLSMSLIKILSSIGLSTDPPRGQCPTWHWSLSAHWHSPVDHYSLDITILPMNPLNSPPIKPTSLQFREGCCRGPCQSLTQVQTDGTHSSSLVHGCSHCMIECHLVFQARLTLSRAMLAASNHHAVL